MITKNISQNTGKLLILLVIATIILLIAGLTTASNAGAKGASSCFGTYLVDVTQSEGIWTLSQDGTVQVTDSNEQLFSFSHQQGSWESTGSKTAKMTFLDFTFDPDTSAHNGYARSDAELAFEKDCGSFSGALDLRIYGLSGDPLVPTGELLLIEDIGFTGRRVNP
jgi:hypothetical protein